MQPGRRITAMEPAPGSSRAVDLYVDGEFWRRTNKRAARDAGFAVGVELNPAVVETLNDKERAIAQEGSLRLLGYRARSMAEIRAKLTASGLGLEAVEAQIGRLVAAGYLDDAEFARAWIDERVRISQYGRRRITSELIARGVDQEMFTPYLDELCSDDTELERAARAVKKKFFSVGRAETVRELHRAHQWLLGRGFSNGVARSAINQCDKEQKRISGSSEPRGFLDTPESRLYDDVGR